MKILKNNHKISLNIFKILVISANYDVRLIEIVKVCNNKGRFSASCLKNDPSEPRYAVISSITRESLREIKQFFVRYKPSLYQKCRLSSCSYPNFSVMKSYAKQHPLNYLVYTCNYKEQRRDNI